VSGRFLPARFLPSGRSILVGLTLLALAGGAYAAARQTSLFAVAHIEITGAPPEVQKQVRRELAPLLGTSLLALDGGSLERRLESLPSVVRVGYDRSFPHTLRLTVVPETPVAVLHRGAETWLFSGRGRVVKRIPPGTYPALPRIWVPHATQVAAGELVQPDGAGSAARALALGARFPARIATAAMTHNELCAATPLGARAPARCADRRAPQARRRAACAARPPGRRRVSRRERARPAGRRWRTLDSEVEVECMNSQALIDSQMQHIYPAARTTYSSPYAPPKVQVSSL